MYDQEKKVQRAQLTSDTFINSLSALLQFCAHPKGSKHSVYHTLPGTGMLSKIFLYSSQIWTLLETRCLNAGTTALFQIGSSLVLS